MISIFNGNYSEAMIVKNIFENEGIRVFVANENMSTIEPVAIAAGGFNNVSLHVDQTDFEKATQILENYKNGNLSLDQ